jgi:hypothetical protein
MNASGAGMPASRHEHGLPADPAMPGFGSALDVGEIGCHLQVLLDRFGYDFGRCNLDRFRYRRGERLVVVYRIEATDRRRAAPRSLLVAGRIHAARPVTRESEDGAAASGTGGLPCKAVLPGLGMRLEIFPHDRRLPGLRALVEGPCSPDMAGLLSAAAGWAPSFRQDIEVEPVRYRPGIAATVRLSSKSAGQVGGASRCFAKLVAAGEAGAEPCAAAGLDRVLEREGSPVRLSLPAAQDRGAGITVYAPAAGRSLQHLARAVDAPLAEARAAGRALAGLHLVRDSGLPQASGERELRKYERAGRFLSWACPGARMALRQIEARASAFWNNGITGTMHGDMKPDHVFIAPDGRSVTLIDNDAVARANPLVDIGSLLVRLEAMHWLEGVDQDRAREMSAQAGSAYMEMVPADWARHLGHARALATLLVCQHAVQRLVPGWRRQVVGELEKAAALA